VATLGELTAAIAHEVNQPLTGLATSGYACLRWLARDPPNLDEARQSVERMINDGRRAGEVIGRIRAMVTKSPSQRGRLSINNAIMEVVALLSAEIQRNRISLQTELSSDLPLIMGDRVQLQQVILNLMMNAIDAMSQTGQSPRELSVAAAMDGSNAVLVTVRDSGRELDETTRERLFDAFYTTKPDGMGMGLAITRRIVEAHGGQIWATPSTPRGAKFEFRLPTDGPQQLP
jgi:C4-dicarboxylate-specific signal transduction histidine kinase